MFCKIGEIDVLAEECKSGTLILIEVRGRQNSNYLPSQYLSSSKVQRLKRLGQWVCLKYRRQIRIEFLEVIGSMDTKVMRIPLLREWMLGWKPEWLGMRWKVFRI